MRRLTIAVFCCFVLAGCEHATNPVPLPPLQPAPASPTAAVGYKMLYSFRGYPSGANPTGLTPFSGALYGTTAQGGAHTFGTIFVRTTAGVRIVHSFTGGTDGSGPAGAMVALGGKLYGTTEYGGPSGNGTVFEVTAQGHQRVVYSFKGGTDGATPNIGGLLAFNGKLYGTTSAGGDDNCHVAGSAGCGIVFSLTPSGTERVLYRFRGKPDGAAPIGALVAVNGALYGTTSFGGTYDNGSVFKMTTAGARRPLYSFKGFPDGASPYAGLLFYKGNFYGTTAFGGASDYSGTVFALTPSGTEHVLHSFGGYPDGAVPYDSLVAVGGMLYGTTQYGGQSSQRCTGHGIVGCGIVFSITPAGKERVLYRFKGDPDGSNPWTGVFPWQGALYGTTVSGGRGGEGSLFSIAAK